MEITERELHRMVRDADDLNRAGMETMADDIAELHGGEGRHVMGASRRHFVEGIGGTAVALAIGGSLIPLSSLWSSAWAETGTDKSIAQFAESVELAAVMAYTAAAATGKVTGTALTLAKTFSNHHRLHANAFGSYAGDATTARPNPGLAAAIGPRITAAADQSALVKILYDLENSAAATYLVAIGALGDPAALKVTASILPVESQHAVVLGNFLGMQPGENSGTYIPAFLTKTAAVNPSQSPIAAGS